MLVTHRRIPISLIILLVVCGSLSALEIVRSLPSPGPEVHGIASDGESLWCSDFLLDRIYRLDSRTGEILYEFSHDILDGYGGLEWSPDSFLWVSQDRNIDRIHPWSGTKLGRIYAPGC
jgi:hypothetical protein